jgi:hypothetical protein
MSDSQTIFQLGQSGSHKKFDIFGRRFTKIEDFKTIVF